MDPFFILWPVRIFFEVVPMFHLRESRWDWLMIGIVSLNGLRPHLLPIQESGQQPFRMLYIRLTAAATCRGLEVRLR